MTMYDQKLRDKFKATLLSTVYRNAPSVLVDTLFKWDRSKQVYTNVAVQGFFLLFLGGVTYGQEASTKVSDEPDKTE